MTDLETARAAASQALVEWLDGQAALIPAAVPEVERLSWTVKAAAARAVLAGSATDAQTALLDIEARLIGRDALDLAARIAAKADAWQMIAAVLAAARQMGEAQIAAAETPSDTIVALTEAQSTCTAELAALVS